MRAPIFLAVACLVLAGAAPAQATRADLDAVHDTSSIDQSGSRVLQDTVRIHAPSAAVWKALTDQASYRAWIAPASYIDFRIGGRIDVAFDPKSKPGDPVDLSQEITAYVPGRVIAFRNLKNLGLAGGAAYGRLAIVLELTPVGGGNTDVSLSQVGYGAGRDFDALYDFFNSHNPEYLSDLKAFVERKPKG